jgi:tetratricopeptide (TPR) repeat protein
MPTTSSSDSVRRLGDFELIRELGRGGMGIVYEARQVSLNRKVALKVLSGGLGLTSKAVQRFRREAEAAAKLHHTNIVPVYATGEEDGTHFYAMELIDGPSLDHVIRQMRDGANTPKAGEVVKAEPEQPATVGLGTTGPFTPETTTGSSTTSATSSSLGSGSQYFDTVALLIAEVADALEYAHKEGVIHRDIKPSNLLVSPAGRFSLNDFGLARMLEQPGMTMTGEFVGTPAYMSPEQITAGRAPLNHRTDIYSLGATLYELLTLQRPFTGERRDEVIAQIMHKEPKAPRKLNAKVPVDLETICLKCMEKDPDRRYQTAGELGEDLRRYVNRFAIAAKRAGAVQRLVKWARRHPAVTGALASSMLLAIVAALFAYWAWESESQLQAERRQHALEAAMAAAMGGDLDKVEKAINEAELRGASPAEVRMLRGQVAYYRGDTERAIMELEQAVQLAPDSAAARGLLAIAYGMGGDEDRYERTAFELSKLAPRTIEDYMFKGEAEMWSDPPKGLQTINEAVKRGASPLARAIRAGIRVNLASDRFDQRELELALADIQVAMEHLGDNPYVLASKLGVHVFSARLYIDAESAARRKAHLDDAERAARALEPRKALPIPAVGLWSYFELTGQENAGFLVAQHAAKKSHSNQVIFNYALALYRRNHMREAEQALKMRNRNDPAGDFLYACILAELNPTDPGPAREAYKVMANRYKKGTNANYPSNILVFLGHKQEAVDAVRVIRLDDLPDPTNADFFRRVKAQNDYRGGNLDENDYLRLVKDSSWSQCHAYFDVGMTYLAKGSREEARKYFLRSAETYLSGWWSHDFSRCFLARMKDPNWPPWIPAKKTETKQ